VICFEFEPANLAQLQLNLDANPHLAGRIDVVRQPLWDRPGEELRFDPAFGRTMVTAAEGDRSVATTTIDEQLAGGRVDLIKLDVEGAEKRALEGARETIERDRPKLAVSAYHHLEDLVDLPDLIAEMGYRMFLDHFLPAPEETVLFGGRPRLNSEPT
jgi:FkbM family methyltransferase